ncbi:MAG: RluA family pseudouridine synthase [Candidatus Omnitrophica bacterium]|nr:RluA family pseudouridine synthase [Candidatus Omnitrophota bacterium]
MEKKRFTFEVKEEDSGKRLDKFLVEHLSDRCSRSFLQKLIEGGNILLGGNPAKSSHKLIPGDAVDVTIPEAELSALQAQKIPLDVVYEDEHLLVINKPAGLVVHPACGHYGGTLVNALLAHCKDLSGISGELKPGIVHRIDKGTSGLLVVAKTDEAHRKLAKQFKNKTIKRVYAALVKGVVQLDNGIVELPIGRSHYDRKKMAVKFDESSKEALTRYKVLKRFKDFTFIELVLGTGRTHQIRVHMSHIGHPLVGDDAYGGKGPLLSRPALHAKTLGFIHPATRKYMEFTAELPEDMRGIIEGQGNKL